MGHAAIPEGESTTYLGAFLVEPRRHVPGIGDLTGPEAERVGLLASRLGRALGEVAGAEHVYPFVLDHHADHRSCGWWPAIQARRKNIGGSA